MSSADNFANSLDPAQARPKVWPDLETGADPGFLERGFMCINERGFALLILSHKSPMKMK